MENNLHISEKSYNFAFHLKLLQNNTIKHGY